MSEGDVQPSKGPVVVEAHQAGMCLLLVVDLAVPNGEHQIPTTFPQNSSSTHAPLMTTKRPRLMFL